MKGLLLKDLYLSWKYCKVYLFMFFLFAFLAVFGDNNPFFVYYPCLFIGLLPLNLQTFDEKEKWHIYADAMPYSRAQVVSGKYIYGLLTAVFGVALTALAQALRMSLAGSFDPVEYLSILMGILSCSLMLPSLIMPFVFKLGAERGRIIYMVITGAVVAVFLSLYGVFGTPTLSLRISGTLGTAAVLILYGLSWLLSIRFYKNREL